MEERSLLYLQCLQNKLPVRYPVRRAQLYRNKGGFHVPSPPRETLLQASLSPPSDAGRGGILAHVRSSGRTINPLEHVAFRFSGHAICELCGKPIAPVRLIPMVQSVSRILSKTWNTLLFELPARQYITKQRSASLCNV